MAKKKSKKVVTEKGAIISIDTIGVGSTTSPRKTPTTAILGEDKEV